MAKQNAYEVITAKVIKQLESVDPKNWKQPWFTTGTEGLNTNVASGNAYRGINQFLLLLFSPYADTRWGTYKQWADKGAQVCKGEKSTQIIFFNTFEKEQDDGSIRKIPFAKFYNVFNAEQCENVPAAPVIEKPASPAERDAAVEAWVKATGADIRHGQTGAFYKPTADWVGMPDLDTFRPLGESDATTTYYGTLLHELTHWTGHRSRKDRFEKFTRFGDESYAFEELIAEMGAVFACAALGIERTPRPDHAEYLAAWLRVLKKDSKAIVSAAKQAQEAFEFLDAFSNPIELDQAA